VNGFPEPFASETFIPLQGCQVGLFRPNFRNPASFQIGWPKKIVKKFWPFILLRLISSWLALQNMFSLLAFLHRKVSSEENYSYSIFSATHLQIFCDI